MTTAIFQRHLGVGSFFSLTSIGIFLPIPLAAGMQSPDAILFFFLFCVSPYIWMQNNWQWCWSKELMFFLAAAVSATYSYFSNSALGNFYSLWSMFLMPPLLYFTIIQIGHADKVENLERAIKWWGPVIALQLIVSLLFTLGNSMGRELHANANIYWGRSNYISAILIMPTIYLYGTLAQKKRKDALLIICIALSFLGILGTFSRGGLITLFIGISFFHWLKKDFNLKSLLYLMPIALLSYIIAARFDSRFTNLIDVSNLNRLYLWLQALEQFFYKPLFGGGISKVWLYATFLSKESLYSGPHNFLLKLLMDEGLVGTSLFLIMLGSVIFSAHKLYRIEKDPTLLTLFVTALVNSSFEPTFQGYHYSFIFWFFAALTSLKLKHAIAAHTTALTSNPAPQ